MVFRTLFIFLLFIPTSTFGALKCPDLTVEEKLGPKAYQKVVDSIKINPLKRPPPITVVKSPIRNLYESIPTQENLDINGLKILNQTIKEKNRHISSIFDDDHESLGIVETEFDFQNTWVLFDKAERSDVAPSFVKPSGVVPMVRGKGIPTIVFTTLCQFRRQGIQFGKLKKAFSSIIINYRSILELWTSKPVRDWVLKHPNQKIPESVLVLGVKDTQTYLNLNTILTLSGHRIRTIQLTNANAPETLASVLMGYNKIDALAQDAVRTDQSKNNFFEPNIPIPVRFTLSFELEAFGPY